ncbi:ExbD/TolR family protein [Sphaerotilus mobilis]|uniref:Outer membrane transport energization protein ExbD n=1 Tax=Sphaerotilus mobilis TaxID=47994 RepID=A0A4Q7LX31_9BURK|nr:biopolymer transporter ExbD [Sphaerotilus mobilis]RZS58439.1 outer membrane transport energization protein ExbD [Sphaerotilus mobilis]
MAFATFDRRQAHAPVAEINMVPLIDVLLVLLVIFIVAAPLLTHSVNLRLPQASSQPQDPAAVSIDVAIDAQGQRHWNGEPVSRTEAQARMLAAGSLATPPAIRLSADRDVAYRHVAETLADAASAGLTRIGFVSQPQGSSL